MMISKILLKALYVSLIVQAFVGCMFLLGPVLKRDQYGKNYFERGLYAALLSLQFFPFIFIVCSICFIIYYKIKEKN